MQRTRALLTVAGTAALIMCGTPPALAEPAENRPYSQLVPLAALDQDDAELQSPGIDVRPDGTVYVTQKGKQQLYTVGPDGTIGTVPGTWVEPDNEPDSLGTSANAVEIAGDGTVYVTTEGSLNRITPTGADSTVAGGGDAGFFHQGENGGDGGPATEALLFDVQDLALDAAGNRYIADRGNDRIRRIDQNGVITTFAGGGARDTDGVPATEAQLDGPRAVEVDAAGNVYVVEEVGRIRKVGPDGTISTVIGQEGAGFSGDGGPAAKGRIGGRGTHDWEGGGGLDIDAEGNLYVADPANGFVRRIDAEGILSTLGPLVGSTIAVGENGDVYQVTADEIVVLRKETRTESERQEATTPGWTNREPGTLLRVAGTGRSPAHELGREYTSGSWVAAGPDGTAYLSDPLADQVYLVTADGRREAFAGTGDRGRSGDGGAATRARLNHPTAVATDQDGTVYVADHGNHRIRKIAPDGTISTHAKADATSLAIGGDGALYYATDSGIAKIDEGGRKTAIAGGGHAPLDGRLGTPATGIELSGIITIAATADGTVYFATDSPIGIYRVARDGTLSAVAREGSGVFDPKGRTSTDTPNGGISLATGPDGTLYLTDRDDDQVRALQPSGTATVVAAVPEPTHLAVAADGTRLITGADRGALHRVAPDGSLRTDSGLTEGHPDRDAGPAAERPIESVQSIHVQPSGALTVGIIGGVLQVDEDGTLEPFRGFRSPDDYSGIDGQPLAFGQDGSVYASTETAGIERHFPDGTRQPLVGAYVADSGSVRTGVPALTLHPRASGAAVTPRGDLYLTVGATLFRVDEKGALVTATRFRQDATALTAAPDGMLYAIVGERVLRIDGRHRVTTVAGGGTFDDYQENGDGGPAVEADLASPQSLAVSPNGYLYIGTDDGLRRVTPDGTIGTLPILPGRYSDYENADELAVDRHGTVYYAGLGDQRVMAVVRADAVELSTDDPFPWSAVLWTALGIVVLGAAGWWYLRRRAAADGADPTVHSGPEDDDADSTGDSPAAADPDEESSTDQDADENKDENKDKDLA